MSQPADDTIQQPEDGADPQPNLRDLRAAADEGTKAKRELAFVKAGIDTDTPLGKMFANAYQGDLTKDAIKEAWDEIAPKVEPAVQVEAEVQQAQEQQAEQQRAAAQDAARRGIASTPAEPVPERSADVLEEGYKQFHQNMRDGMEREAAAKPVFEAIIAGAANGDQRFVWNGGWTEDEMAEGRISRA